MSDAIFYDDDGKVKLRVYVDGGTPPDLSITKAISGPTFIDADGKTKVRIYADGSDIVQAEGTALPEHVLSPHTFTNDQGQQTGSMIDHTGMSPTQANYQAGIPEEIRIEVPEGFYKSNNPIYPLFVLETNLVEGNIPVGKSLFGITGTYTSDADATAADIRQGKTAYVNGVKITGTAVF